MTIDNRNAVLAIIIGFTVGLCSGPAPADEVEDRTERQWDHYQQDSDRYRDKMEAEQRKQERDNACYLSGERSAMCRAYGDPDRRPEGRRAWR